MPRALLLLAAAAFLYMLGLSVIFPVIPQFVRELSLSETDAGILVSSYTFASFFCAPLWGWFSQRRGRKPAILIGMLGFAAGFLAFGLSSDFWHLLLARLLGGMIAAAVVPAIFAYVADSVTAERRSAALGLVGAAVGLGVLGGVSIGGALGSIDSRLPFLVTAGIGALAALAVALSLPESLTPAVREELLAHQRALGARGLTRAKLVLGLAPFLLYSFLVQTSRSGLEITIGFLVIDRFAGGPMNTGIALAVGTLAGVIVQGGGVRALSRRFSDRGLMLCGTAILSVGLLAVGMVSTWSGLLVAACVLGSGAGLVEPTFRAELARAAEAVQGEAQGLQSSSQSLARGVAFIAFPWLYARWDPEYVFAAAAAVCAAALVLAQVGLRASLEVGSASLANAPDRAVPDTGKLIRRS